MVDKEKLEEDYRWFMSNTETLYKEHGGKIAVVKNKSILGIYDEFLEALETTRKTHELGTFIIQQIYKDKNENTNLRSGYGIYGG